MSSLRDYLRRRRRNRRSHRFMPRWRRCPISRLSNFPVANDANFHRSRSAHHRRDRLRGAFRQLPNAEDSLGEGVDGAPGRFCRFVKETMSAADVDQIGDRSAFEKKGSFGEMEGEDNLLDFPFFFESVRRDRRNHVSMRRRSIPDRVSPQFGRARLLIAIWKSTKPGWSGSVIR
jgi:hypothetical protein